MIRAVLLDKDGTLTDFRATWEPWLARIIPELAETAGADEKGIAADFGFDPSTGTIHSHAAFVTAPGHVTNGIVSRRIGWNAARLEVWLGARSAGVAQVVVPGAIEAVHELADAGLPIGVLTNANVAEAERHLRDMGLADVLCRVIGQDSGFGAKPEPAGAADFARSLGLAPGEVALVGDGMTDMKAARGAGLIAVGVLTGTLDRAALAPHAAAVLPDVTYLPAWLRGGWDRDSP